VKPDAGDRPPDAEEVLLSADGLKMHFPLRGGLLGSVRGHVHAVDDVSLRIRKGETLAIVGESGSGKTTLARVLLRLLEPTAGRVSFLGQDLGSQSHRAVRELRRHLQMVFQDPMSSLDPRLTVKAIVSEPLVVHDRPSDRPPVVTALAILTGLGGLGTFLLGLSLILNTLLVGYVGLLFPAEPSIVLGLVFVGYGTVEMSAAWGFWALRTWAWWTLFVLAIVNLVSWITLTSLPGSLAAVGILVGLLALRNRFLSGEKITARVLELLDLVGLKKEHLNRFPHEFSGGQRQRINIARALALQPDVIILDEPTSALDVSVQAQILNLLMELQRRLGLTYLFITHDLSVVYHIADRVAVMYAGQIVEIGRTEDIFGNPLHPYTKALISAAPTADPAVKVQRIVLEGEVPSSIHPPSGCRFHPRCWLAFDPCASVVPHLFDVGNGRLVSCFAVARDIGRWDIGGPQARTEAAEAE
jgi:oligopeptide/dipeptide ABC transporter ATP-binding protein